MRYRRAPETRKTACTIVENTGLLALQDMGKRGHNQAVRSPIIGMQINMPTALSCASFSA
eukprot:6482882-Amphidinium_carterae.1